MAPETPRSVSSNPNLSASRKASLQDLNLGAAASSSNESLTTPTFISSPRMATTQTSVQARARAFEHRAQTGRGTTTLSPATSPPPISPFVKSIGARILIPQSIAKVTVASQAPDIKSASASLPNTPVVDNSSQPDAQMVEDEVQAESPTRTVAPGSVSAESLPTSVTSRKPSLVPTDGVSSEDDRTPRQSATYPAPSTSNLSRMDSSRQTGYSLKAQTYSPEPESEKRESGGRAEAPRLPKLFFEGALAQDGTHAALPSAKSIRSPYSSPNTELARAGWTNDEVAHVHKHGTSLTVPPPDYQPQIVDSPPPDDMDASNRSFFWHSPNDTDETDDEADIEDNPGGFPSLPRRSDTSMTSANVFGPGGPSDWEHFYGGDYETELVDDTDMYMSTKEKERLAHEKEERLKAAAEARRRSADDDTHANEVTQRLNELQKDEEVTGAKALVKPSLPTIEETLQEETIQDEEDAAAEEEAADDDIRQTDIDYNLEADALDGFARSPPPATPATFREKRVTMDEPLPVIVEKSSKETIREGEDAAEEPAPELKEAPLEQGQEKEQQRPDSETEPAAQPITQRRTPPPPEIKMPEAEIKSPDDAKSGPSSPPIDDPNAGHITVSMVLPADFNPTTAMGSPQSRMSSQRTSRASPPLSAPKRPKSLFPQADELPNPYQGLSPMAKASLNRFVRMLNEEEAQDSDPDKFFVFIAFAQHEMKLRATLYDMEDEEVSLPASKRASARSSINKKLSRSQPSLRSKPLPTAPATMPPFDPTLGRNQSISVAAANRSSSAVGSPPHPPPTRSPPPAPTTGSEKSGKSSDESFVIVDAPENKTTESTSASPTAPSKSSMDGDKKASLETLNKSIDLVAPRTSIISDPAGLVDSPDKALSERQSAASSPLPAAQILNHSLSAKSNESKPYDGDKATNRQSIYRPFSGMLRSSSSHRRASMESVRTLRSVDKSERKTTDSVAIASMVEEHLSKTDTAIATDDSQPPRSPTFKDPSFEPLVSVVPQSNVLREEPQQLVRLRFDMDNILDDFSFIHRTVLAWDSGAKVKRERYEHDRQVRLNANERRVEDLFNDNEIGYADISSLEAEFKQAESVKKAEEEREEVESFVASVFDVVWARINYEMDQLTPLYQEATQLVADASAGKQMFEDTEERVPIAPIMEVLLILYQKLMIRHQKAFEAVLERDRRLKKTEVSPWFAIGQIDKVKRIEKRFEDAEKKAILEFCRQRDERANLLMDVLDQHTLRGVGANQDYMESVMQAIRKISVHLAKSDLAGDEKGPAASDEVTKAKFITIALSRSSEQIVRTFHIADMLLNAADYEVSVANAKLSNADAAAFRRLREAKAKEDAKLAADLEHRIGLIRGDTQRTQEEVGKLMALLGQEDPDLPFDLGRERDKRIVAALAGDKAGKKGKNQASSGQQNLMPPSN